VRVSALLRLLLFRNSWESQNSINSAVSCSLGAGVPSPPGQSQEANTKIKIFYHQKESRKVLKDTVGLSYRVPVRGLYIHFKAAANSKKPRRRFWEVAV